MFATQDAWRVFKAINFPKIPEIGRRTEHRLLIAILCVMETANSGFLSAKALLTIISHSCLNSPYQAVTFIFFTERKYSLNLLIFFFFLL
ncbi:hypothetical protein M5K25_027145 [Dendrobium thyrsiflorum]|uniref:Uncharacterized protein n=1 Tax=Dendrobium thyrsiflorum TaxID=117978 RepID=A0ABD0TZ02_DENTH